MAGELLPRAAGQRGQRPHSQPLQPRRHQLRGGRGLRLLAGRRAHGHAGARGRPLLHGSHRRRGLLQRHFHVHVLQQDPGAVGLRRRQVLRRLRRRHRPGRGPGHDGDEAPRGRREGRRPDLRRAQGRGLLLRRQGQGHLRPQLRGPGPRAAQRLRRGRRGPLHRGTRRGARHRHHRGRRRGTGRPHRGLPRQQEGGHLVRPRLGKIHDRPHQGRSRLGGPDKGRPLALQQNPPPDYKGQRPAEAAGRRYHPLLPQRRPAPLGKERPPAPRRRLRPGLRRLQFPRHTRGAYPGQGAARLGWRRADRRLLRQ